jgi:hypothetical protein
VDKGRRRMLVGVDRKEIPDYYQHHSTEEYTGSSAEKVLKKPLETL